MRQSFWSLLFIAAQGLFVFDTFAAEPDFKACRARIPTLLCFAKATDKLSEEYGNEGRCVSSASQYGEEFEEVFDRYPAPMKQVFCVLEKIYVETSNSWITAYTQVIRDKKHKPLGVLYGVHERILKNGNSFDLLESLREQKSFGNNTQSLRDDLPYVESTIPHGFNATLFQATAHEFAHIFDEMNNINPQHDELKCHESPDPSQNEDCQIEPMQWATLSWTSTKTVRKEDDFPLRKKFCFIFCDHFGSYASVDNSAEMYRGLERSSFLTTFSTLQPWDDWADTLAFYLLGQQEGFSFVVHTRQGFDYDMTAKIGAPQFAPKRRYIERFLKRTDLIYPPLKSYENHPI